MVMLVVVIVVVYYIWCILIFVVVMFGILGVSDKLGVKWKVIKLVKF